MDNYSYRRRYCSHDGCGTHCFQPSASGAKMTSPCCNPVQQKLVNCQCKSSDLEGKVFNLQRELHNAEVNKSLCCNELQNTKREVCEKDKALAGQESKLKEIQCEMRNKDKQHQRTTCNVEGMLAVCQDSSYQKSVCLDECHTEVSQLKCQLEKVCVELKEKKCHNEKLDLALLDVKGRYHETCAELDECKKTVTCLKGKISHLECQSKRDKQQFNCELQAAQARVQRASEEAKCVAEGLNTLKTVLQEKECEIRVCCNDKNAMCQELNCNKEKVVKLTDLVEQMKCEISALQSEFDRVKCEVERLYRDIECYKSQLQQKQNEVSALCNEKNHLTSDVKQLKSRYDKDTCKLQQAMSEMKQRFEKDICHLQSCIRNLEDKNCSLKAQVRSCQQRSEVREREYCTQLDQMSQESSHLRAQLQDREIQLNVVKESVNEKNCEIIRMCSVDRSTKCCPKNFCHNNACAPLPKSPCSSGSGRSSPLTALHGCDEES